MATKLFPQELSTSQKREFFAQESFESQMKQRKTLIIVPFTLILSKLIFDLVGYPEVTGRSYRTSATVSLAAIGGGVVGYIIAAILDMRKKTRKLHTFRALAILITWLAGLIYVTSTMWFCTEEALLSGDQTNWMINLIELANSIHITVLVNVFVPIWYIKGSIACCYFLGILIGLFRANNSLKYWFLAKCVFYSIYVLILYFYQSRLRWQLFTKNLETEAWSKIYQDLLNRIPSAIAVMNLDSKIVYSNEEFKKLSNNEEKKLFSSLIQIKKRAHIIHKREEELSRREDIREYAPCLLSPSPNNLHHSFDEASKLSESEAIDDLSLARKSFTLLKNRMKLEDLGKPKNLSAASDFMDLGELLEAFKNSFNDGKEEIHENNLIYDGKMSNPNETVKTLQTETKMFSYEIRLFPLYDYQKVIISLNNTTQRDVIAALEDNNDYKDRLLASISHELRTPLNANISLLEAAIIDGGIMNSAKETMLEPALRSAKMLFYIINDILDYSLIQSQELKLFLEPKSLKDTLTNTFKLLERAMKAKFLNFILELDRNLPRKFLTDHERVTQITLNLLNNALKFTSHGNVILKAICVDPDVVEISVEDTGQGMKVPEARSIFFDMNSETKEPSQPGSKSKGIGLGLKIANNLVKRLAPIGRDSIVVETEEGRGSKFSFYLKNQEVQALNMSEKIERQRIIEKINRPFRSEATIMEDFPSLPEIESVSEADVKNRKVKDFFNYENMTKQTLGHIKDETSYSRRSLHSIGASERAGSPSESLLIVDDDPFNILALKAHLKSYKFAIDEAYNGEQAIQKVKKKCKLQAKGCNKGYKIIFMDCQMPIMDGYEASKKLIKMMEVGEIPQIPIIGCTAFTSKTKIDECYNSGMKNVITKPVMKDRLFEILNRYK